MTHTRSLLAGCRTPEHVIPVDALPENPSGTILERQLRGTYHDVGRS